MDNKEIIEHNKILNWQVLIKNSITLICFTILAIVFNKWWLVLLSIIFWTYIERQNEDKEL